ncbi:hypothetical protein JCM5296_006718 [Sporobolomyces johnsonii]
MQKEQRKAIDALFDHWNAYNLDGIASQLSDLPNFVWYLRPGSLHRLAEKGKPYDPDAGKLTKAQILDLFKRLPKLIKYNNFPKPLDVIQEGDRIAVRNVANGELADGTPYRGDYVHIITFEPGTTKILECSEMVDSALVLELFQRHDFQR